MTDRTATWEDFETFHARAYRRVLRRAVLWCGGHQEDAEDAVQEAFAVAARKWDVVGAHDLPEAWVLLVATRILGKARHRWARSFDAATRLPVPRQALPEETAEVRAVLNAIRRLPLRKCWVTG